jgi:hypothetical protein
MTFSNPQPLALASKILEPETLATFRRPPYTLQGWKILDRWALNSHWELKAMEQNDLISLYNRVLDQQTLETKVLTDALAHSQGMTEHEILAQNEVNTEL